MQARGCFIAGTDTGVGKTHVATALVRGLAREGLRVAAMKPVAAGAERTEAGLRNEDALALAGAANVPAAYELVNPCCLPLPASPHIAAEAARQAIDVQGIRRSFDALARQADCVVVEGAGGWLAPISRSETMADIARALALPVVLVVGLRLGCLNHARLTAQAIRADGLPIAGWIGNQPQPDFEYAAENLAMLERILGSAPFAVLPFDPGRLGAATLDAGPAWRAMSAMRP